MLETEQTSVYLKSSSFLPEEIQMELLHLSETFKRGYFRIGDLAAACISAFAHSGIVTTNQEVFNEIGRFCGKSGRTIRYYYETAVFFPKEIRDRYDALPFSHFVFARSYGDWEAVLQYAQERPYISEDQLRYHFLGVPAFVPGDTLGPESEQGVQSSQLGEQLSGQVGHNHNPHSYIQAASRLREGAKMLSWLLVDSIGDEDRVYIEQLMEQLNSAAERILRLVEKSA